MDTGAPSQTSTIPYHTIPYHTIHTCSMMAPMSLVAIDFEVGSGPSRACLLYQQSTQQRTTGTKKERVRERHTTIRCVAQSAHGRPHSVLMLVAAVALAAVATGLKGVTARQQQEHATPPVVVDVAWGVPVARTPIINTWHDTSGGAQGNPNHDSVYPPTVKSNKAGSCVRVHVVGGRFCMLDTNESA